MKTDKEEIQLSLELCKKCKEDIKANNYNKLVMGASWSITDTFTMHTYGGFTCPALNGGNVYVKDGMPDECPFRLEHLLEHGKSLHEA